jgi:peptidoglycan-N-acetylglucosamine deacetylase
VTRVSLTFDNGPTPGVTERVLSVLAERGLPATFFVIGQKAATPAGRALISAELAAGHRVGHHTWSHTVRLADRAAAAPDFLDREFDRPLRLLRELGARENLYRPYGRGGVLDQHVLSCAGIERMRASGATCVLWNSVPRDWEGGDWLPRAREDVARHDWTVTVLHDLEPGCGGQLEPFLDWLGERGAEVVRELPLECTPVVDGELVGAIEHLTPAGSARQDSG